VLADQNPLTVGAYHTADVPYWFGTLEAFNIFRSTRVWGDYDRKLSAQMMQSLVALAGAGSPDTPGLTWPAWSKRDEHYLVLGDEVRTEKLAVKRMDWLEAHPPAQSSIPPRPAGPRD
jgi:para-nitrobenzyl esterase